ncbi:MAG: hypothetical protein PHC61_07570, partial [Chitinivibrionales bacterium]|nr:hypothetical protein [Chitinivibrionales bacterium]
MKAKQETHGLLQAGSSKGILILILTFNMSVFASTITWTGGGSDESWHTVANWDAGVVPTSNDDVVFDGSGPKACSLFVLFGVASCKSITFSSSYTYNFKFGQDTLKIYGSSGYPADFRSAGSFTYDSSKAAIQFLGTAATFYQFWGTTGPKTLPTIIIDIGPGNLLLSGLLKCGPGTALVLKSGTLDCGSTSGFFDTVYNIYGVGGSINFDGAQVSALGDTVNFNFINQVSASNVDGALCFGGHQKKQFFIPSPTAVFPKVKCSGQYDTVLVITNSLKAKIVESMPGAGYGQWQWGSGLTHLIDTLWLDQGSMDFGSSTVKIMKGTAQLRYGSVFKNSGTLEFAGSNGPGFCQVLSSPNGGDILPNIIHSGSDSLRLDAAGPLVMSCQSFSQTNGYLDLDGRNIVTQGNFSITNGTPATLAWFQGVPKHTLDGRKITVGGNCVLEGISQSTLLNFAAYGLPCTVSVAGTVMAQFDSIANCKLFGPTTVALGSKKNWGDSNWVFVRTWKSAGTNNRWTDYTNWNEGQVPDTADSVLFNAGAEACSLDVYMGYPSENRDTIGSITFTSGYSGVFKFGACTLSVLKSVDFRSGGGIQPNLGALRFCNSGLGTRTFIPHPSAIMPKIIKAGNQDTVRISTYGLKSLGVIMSASAYGMWDWGNQGLVHQVGFFSEIMPSAYINFGNSKLKITDTIPGSHNALSLSSVNLLSLPGAAVEFCGNTPTVDTQTISVGNGMLPMIVHSGTGVLQLALSIPFNAKSLINTAGQINLNYNNNIKIMDSLIIINGNAGTFVDNFGTNCLEGRKIRVGGKAKLFGQPGNLLNLKAPGLCSLLVNDSLIADFTQIKNIRADSTNGAVGWALARAGCADSGGNTRWDFPPIVQNNALTFPNGGNLLRMDSSSSIQWNPSVIVDPIGLGLNSANCLRLELSTDGGATFPTIIANNQSLSGGAMSWMVPNSVSGNTMRIRLAITDNAGTASYDTSDANFSILDLTPPTVTPGRITYPVAGTKWPGNSNMNSVSFIGQGINDAGGLKQKPVWIEISYDSGATFSTFYNAPVALNAGTVTGITAAVTSNKCRIRLSVSDSAGNIGYDTSGVFTVDNTPPTVNVIAPVNKSFFNLANIALNGTAADSGTSVRSVSVAVRRLSDNLYLSAATNGIFNQTKSTYFAAQGTTSWNFAFSGAPFIDGNAYIFEILSADQVALSSRTTFDTLYFDATPPVSSLNGVYPRYIQQARPFDGT